MRATVSRFGRRFHGSLLANLIANEPFKVIERRVKCDCGYEELDPDSTHTIGCAHLWTKVQLSNGSTQTVAWSDIEESGSS